MSMDWGKTPITVTCTAKDIAFELRTLSGREELGRLFEYELELLSVTPGYDHTKILGQSLTVKLPLDAVKSRFFNGVIVRFGQAGRDGRFFLYRVTICPSLWLLDRNSDCRVFQGATVPDVVKWVLAQGGVKMFDKPVLGDHRKWENLTQYRESDFTFVSRVLEQEGIYFYFKHTEDAHTLVLADSVSGHDPRPGYDKVPVATPDWLPGTEKDDFLTSFDGAHQIQTSSVVLDDFDFRLRKGADIAATKSDTPEQPHGPLIRYDYPGEYTLTEDKPDADAEKTRHAGEGYALFQLQEHRAELERFTGAGNVRGLETGALFSIANLPELQARKFLITSSEIELRNPAFESGKADVNETCHVTITAMDSQRTFRPARRTPKPLIAGPQTARVVGDAGTSTADEIWTDKFGRIKVHFHWDRHGPATPGQGAPPPPADKPGFVDHGSSCWLRVATPWAGNKWGAIHIPRIGQEVIVQFLEGDPDRPIVTGSVYNADNPPPYELSANKTQSGIKSRSSPKGTASNFNEIRFEDKKGDEHLFIQAEKDKTVNVKHNRSATIGANDSITVGGDRSVHVTGNLSTTVDGKGKSPIHSTLSVTGKHSTHASDTIDMDAPNHIKLVCKDSSILMEPGKITITAGGKAFIVLDAHVLAQSKDESKLVLDAHVLAHSSNGSDMLLDANAALTAKADATIDGVNVKATGKTEAVVSAGAGSVKTNAGGVEVTGPAVKLNA